MYSCSRDYFMHFFMSIKQPENWVLEQNANDLSQGSVYWNMATESRKSSKTI